MIANYHTHTWRCNHAQGTEREYIEAAIQSGIKILGFSDHSPYCFKDGYKSRIRMTPEQLSEYIRTLEGLREEYKGQIELHIGLEAEYFPGLFPDLLALLEEHPVEYLILGQHRLGDGVGEFYCGTENTDESLLSRYCDQCMEAMNTGLFTYIAHPDIFNYVGDDAVYCRHMSELCREANRCQMPVEVNFAGLREGIWYPNPLFWEIAAEEGCTAIFGIDAHAPEAFDFGDTERQALELVNKPGLRLAQTVELKPVVRGRS